MFKIGVAIVGSMLLAGATLTVAFLYTCLYEDAQRSFEHKNYVDAFVPLILLTIFVIGAILLVVGVIIERFR